MNTPTSRKLIALFIASISFLNISFAQENYLYQAKDSQRKGLFDQAIKAYTDYLLQPVGENCLDSKDLNIYTDALVQLMNSFQSKGEPEACVSALQEIFDAAPALRTQCLRDYYSVLGYALSRTENMSEAEDTMLKALALPLYSASPERYFRDYAYAAAVFYSNPDYHDEVIIWCQQAMQQALICNNTSGKQWVTAMLGSLYKRDGDLHEAFSLFQESKADAQSRNDELGVLNSLNSLVDLFLYWDLPEYANTYATESIKVERNMTVRNPMVSAQTYISKGRALYYLGETDSILFYSERARKYCESLPYNSGMVDVDLLNGIFLTEKGGVSLPSGIHELENVTQNGTATNRAKAYHQLAQTYLKNDESEMADIMLDSLLALLHQNPAHNHILHLDYKPILNHYLKMKNHEKVEQYVRLLLQEQQEFKENRVNSNLVDAIVEFQTEKKLQEMKILELKQANQRLMLFVLLSISAFIIVLIVLLFFWQKRRYKVKMKLADMQLDALIEKMNQSYLEKELFAQEIKEFLKDKEKQQELLTLTPYVLKESGETKFRQYFELLHPLFLHRLRERVPAVTPREELLSMLIVLKQDNKEIAELLAVAPRSVLMLRHRFRQKIGLTTEHSLEIFIESMLDKQ